MRPPCEIVQRDFLPDLRASLSKKLKETGLSQMEIAERIGLTQAAVSKYLQQKDKKRRIDHYIDVLASRLADGLRDNSISSAEVLKEVCGTCMTLRIGSEICSLHRKAITSLDEEECIICSELLGGSDQELTIRSSVLIDMQEGLEIIENSTTFFLLVPEVRANLVACSKDASTIPEVAGVPGRITLIQGKARVFSGPQFGTSRHTASLLLRVKERWSSYRACLCIGGSTSVIDASEKEGVHVIHLDHSAHDASTIAEYALCTQQSRPKGFLGIHVPGGIGVEPILYIFGKSAVQLADLSEKIGLRLA